MLNLPLLSAALIGCKDKTDDTTATDDSPTWWQDVAPLYAARCVGCHQDGAVGPMRLDTYADAATWATASAAATAARTMPPWAVEEHTDEPGGEALAEDVPDPSSCDNSYVDSLWMTDEEIRTIQAWVDAGTPEGTEAEVAWPSPPVLTGGEDHITPEFLPEAVGGGYGDSDEYRCFLVDPGWTEDAWLTGYEVFPGNDAIVHHVIGMPVDLDATASGGLSNRERIAVLDAEDDRDGWPCYSGAGDGVGIEGEHVSWAPGQGMVQFPEGSGLEVNAGEVMVYQIHYNIISEQGTDSTTVRLQLEDSVERPGMILLLDLWDRETLDAGDPAAVIDWQISRRSLLNYAGLDEIQIEGVLPHMHTLGVQETMEIGSSDDRTCTTGVRSWNFNWQRIYFYEDPVMMQDGESMRVTCTYDLSGVDYDVSWGWGTQDEMCLMGIYVTEG